MLLSNLLSKVGISIESNSDFFVEGLTSDSRLVKENYIFFAINGAQMDGYNFIDDAIVSGAKALFVENDARGLSEKILIVHSENIRSLYAKLVSFFYHGKPDNIVAVTGTNGKTSVADFCRQIWDFLGFNSASIGTMGVVSKSYNSPSTLTTPDPVFLHTACSRLALEGVKYLAVEASSHGLSQGRLDGLKVDVAGFTYLGRDHLDYHGSLNSYFLAKKRLFSDLLFEDGIAVLNADIKEYAEIADICKRVGKEVFTYGFNGSDLRLTNISYMQKSLKVDFLYQGQSKSFNTKLIGNFQVMNLLCAIGLVLKSGADFNDIIEVLNLIRPVRGRLEYIGGENKDVSIFIDYAHTPEAISNSLNVLRPHTKAKLAILFGAGGNRDFGKRVLMGEAASSFADIIYITDDNPRLENPEKIRKDILRGCPNAQEIPNRLEAIRSAISSLDSGDVLLIAGKGHETSQILGDTAFPFNDKEIALEALKRSETH